MMNCKQTLTLLDDYIDALLDESERRAVASHLGQCPSCHEQLEAERALRRALHKLAAPEPDADFFERTLQEAARQAQQQRRHRRGIWAGGAIAASLVLALMAPVLLKGPDLSPTQQVASSDAALPGIRIALGEVHKVSLAIDAAMTIDRATFVIALPPGTEISGLPGQRVVRWQGQLKQGKNLLELPVIVNEGHGGVLEARIEHGNKRSVYRVKMAVEDPSRVAI